jgi:hypothetical protein
MAAVTIADLIRDRQMLWVYCRECGRERDLDVGSGSSQSEKSPGLMPLTR